MTPLLAMMIAIVAPCVFADTRTWPPPPDWKEKAKMARYLVHNADWAIVAGVSPEYQMMPFGTVQSFADGPQDNSTGIPYFYISDLSDTHHNVQHNSSVSMTISLDQSLYCHDNEIDTEEPTCSRVTLFGKMEEVKSDTEQKFARKSMFVRHPAMQSWPSSHGRLHYNEVVCTTAQGCHFPSPDRTVIFYSNVPYVYHFPRNTDAPLTRHIHTAKRVETYLNHERPFTWVRDQRHETQHVTIRERSRDPTKY